MLSSLQACINLLHKEEYKRAVGCERRHRIWRSKSKTNLDSKDWKMESESPPRQSCCFCYSPKKLAKKKSKTSGVAELNLDGRNWGKNDEILSDMSTFSLKEQQKRLKNALKEEGKVTQQAEKVVEWVKQASARIDVSAVEDALRDNEKSK